MMTIQERIKTKTFYKCSHCNDPGHTKRKCTNLDKVYDIPKKKRSRKTNQPSTADGGQGRQNARREKNKEINATNIPTDEVSQLQQ